jgi:hypothetical protein
MVDHLAYIRQLVAQGHVEEAQTSLDALLRSQPYNAEAWRLAVQIAPTPALRANAQSGLQRALAMQQAAPPPQYVPVQPVYVQAAPVYVPAAPVRYEKDYLPEALIALVMYFIGGGIIGLILNLVFLANANRDQQQGIPVRNAGCLKALLIADLVVLSLSCVLVAVYFVFFAAMVGTSAAS